MASRSLDIGDVGRAVASCIRNRREQLGLTQAELAMRVTEAGRPMAMSAVSKVETGERRVDVADLVAIARALGVSPITLLMPDVDRDEPAGPAYANQAGVVVWQWLGGSVPLPEEGRDRAEHIDEFRRAVAPRWWAVLFESSPLIQAVRRLWEAALHFRLYEKHEPQTFGPALAAGIAGQRLHTTLRAVHAEVDAVAEPINSAMPVDGVWTNVRGVRLADGSIFVTGENRADEGPGEAQR